MAHSRSFLANQKARNAIVGAENLLNIVNQARTSILNSIWTKCEVTQDGWILAKSLFACLTWTIPAKPQSTKTWRRLETFAL